MISHGSAEGAQYESQGQAPNNVRRVAPGSAQNLRTGSAAGAQYESQGQAPNNVRRVAPGASAQ